MNISSIRLECITKTFKQSQKNLVVFEGISVLFKKGLSYALTGVSGSGKSTLLQLAAGLDEPTEGKVYFDRYALFGMSSKKKDYYANNCLGFMFQQPYLIGELSVLENVMIKALIGGRSSEKARQEARFLLQEFGLYQKIHHYPNHLSGGQQQRVALARALVNKPDFLFADEPTGNLDEKTSNHIIEVVLEYQNKYSMGLIMSTHNTTLAQKLDYRWHICDGKIIQKSLFLKNIDKTQEVNRL